MASPNAALASDAAWPIRLSSWSSARHDLHAAPAAARGGLDQHRIADLGGDLARLLDACERAGRAGDQRQAELRGGALGLDLVAHDADMLGLGPDPDQVVALDDLGELGVFGQEAVARVDRVGVGDFGRRDDVGDVEIAVLGRRRADADRFVGQADVHRVGCRRSNAPRPS